jgi:hypothetical protein
MAAPIRSGPTLPTPAPAAGGASPGARAAQRAFFEAALGRATTAPAAAAPQPQIQTPAAAPARAVQPTAEPQQPQRLLRPGSLVDIKV